MEHTRTRKREGGARRRGGWQAVALGLLLAACGSGDARSEAGSGEVARATLVNPQGNEVGEVELRDTPNGVLLHATLVGVPPGTHAFHLHTTGACRPDFSAAGGHFAPDGHAHGFLDPKGPHAGDLPNIVVPDSGRLEFETIARGARLEGDDAALLDDDGAAVMIHAGPDDYRSQPAGAAGSRIACGVVEDGSQS